MLDRPKIKNTKALRKAKRKSARSAGWTEAKQATKDLLVGTTIRDLESGAKAAKEGKPGMDFVNFTTQAVRNAVHEIPTNVKNVGKLLKGTFKGIFNHPDWYKYKGTLSIPAHNILRPFGQTSLRPVQKKDWYVSRTNKVVGSGAGVTHVCQIAVKFNDMRDDDSFKLAMIEAFRSIRLDLKSNLPYKQSAYDNYVTMACSIYVKAKAIEKMLGWYNYTRADIPEFSRATQYIPENYLEQGVVTPKAINMLVGDNYARTLNDFKKLKSIINNIAIPRKLAEYLSWWVGSMFIDQAAPNPQIYTTILRSAPKYQATDVDNPLTIEYSWDMSNGGVDEVIEEAMNLLNVYGVLNADIIKTGRYGVMDVVLPENYNNIFLNDAEFFSILINSYTKQAGKSPESFIFKDDYIRVDALEDVNDVNLVGMSNALAKWAGVNTLCSIESQACYLQVDSTDDLPCGGATPIISGGGYSIICTNESDGAFIQITPELQSTEDVKVTTSAITATMDVDAGIRASSAVIAAASGITFKISAGSHTIDRRSNSCVLVGWFNGSDYIYIGVKRGGTNLIIHNYTTDTTLATLTYSGTISWVGSTVTFTTGTATVAATYAAMAGDTAIWNDFGASNASMVVSYATTATASSVVSLTNDAVFSWFTELVDYHMPIIKRRVIRVFHNDTKISDNLEVPQLLKECYKPMIFNLADISVVLYWMYLGLFSMD